MLDPKNPLTWPVLMKPREVADVVCVSVRTLYRMIAAGSFPPASLKTTRKIVRWSRDSVADWLRDQGVKLDLPPAPAPAPVEEPAAPVAKPRRLRLPHGKGQRPLATPGRVEELARRAAAGRPLFGR